MNAYTRRLNSRHRLWGRVFGDRYKAMLIEPRRLAVAEAIWAQTNVGQGWIAERLGMRSAANVSQQLRVGRATLERALGGKNWRLWQERIKNC